MNFISKILDYSTYAYPIRKGFLEKKIIFYIRLEKIDRHSSLFLLFSEVEHG